MELVVQFPARGSTQVLLCLFPGVLWLWHFLIVYSVGPHQCKASIYTLSLCHGHSLRVRLAKQETPTPPGHLVSPLVCRGTWISTVVLYCWCHSDSFFFLLYFTLEYRKYTAFRNFLLHASIYWAEIWYITFFLLTSSFFSDQVRVLFCVNFCKSYVLFRTYIIANIRSFLLHTLIYWAEILHMTFFLCIRVSTSSSRVPLCIYFLWVMNLLHNNIISTVLCTFLAHALGGGWHFSKVL